MDEIERPKTFVQWTLSNRCNYNCSYCLDIFKKGTVSFPDNDCFVEVCKDIICHYDELGRDVVFEFTGGEPTLLEKIPEIGNRLHNYPTNIVLKTNGSADIDWWKNVRRFLSKVVISAHQEFCDIKHIENVILLLQDDSKYHPVDIEVLFPVTNQDSSFDWGVNNLKLFRKKYNIGDLQLLYSNFGRGSDMYLPYKEHQWNVYNKIYNIPPRIENDIIDEPKNVFKNKTCYAGVDILTIDNLGNVFRGWCQEGGVIGNVYNMPVDWPKDPIICKKEICNNGFDLLARKE